MLCEKCSNIVLRPDPSDDEFLSYHLHDTFRLLRLSAQTCHLCRHVCHKLCLPSNYEAESMLHDRKGPIYIMYLLPESDQYDKRPFVFGLSGFSVYCPDSGNSSRMLGVIDETCFDMPETYEPAQAHDNNLFSARTIRFAKQRMNHCSKFHPTCSSNACLPLRVIEISGNDLAARLVTGSGRVAQYVTLSYKWGGVTRYTMTTANRSSLQCGIPLDQLPKTFSDAIELTHKLGHKYLWIDALCITQDDSRELGEQIAAMEDVYSGSDLTIFAAGGDDANCGLNRTRDATVVYPIQVKVRAELPWLSTTPSKTFWIADALEYDESGSSPLYQRGWVLQEQLLSRRGLVFNHEYVSWRCLCENVSEILPFDRKFSRGYIGHNEHLLDSDGLAQTRNWFWAKSTDVLHKAQFPLDPYYKSIENYMKRELTLRSDALPAIAGLLAMTEQRTGAKFYYGTCLQDTTGFLWWSDLREDRLNGSSISPSWSWTSCSRYDGYFLDAKSFDYTWQVAEHHNTRDRGGLEIISWTQWGTLLGNRVRCCTPPTREHCEMQYVSVEQHVYMDVYRSADEIKATGAQTVLCIFIANDKEHNYVLITVPCHGEEDTFVRIGMGEWEPHTVFNVVEAVERQGAVMNSQRYDDDPQRTVQYLV